MPKYKINSGKRDKIKPLTQKEYNFLAEKIIEGICDFETLYLLARTQVITELKQNPKRAKEELNFSKISKQTN